jgi:predicted nucleic acid-binding protein
MIIPDVNVLVYAHNAGVPEHVRVRQWREGVVNGAGPVGLPWACVLGFVHLAALAIELNATLATTDADFSRFPGLQSMNPLT